jgi:hypothetical protein
MTSPSTTSQPCRREPLRVCAFGDASACLHGSSRRGGWCAGERGDRPVRRAAHGVRGRAALQEEYEELRSECDRMKLHVNPTVRGRAKTGRDGRAGCEAELSACSRGVAVTAGRGRAGCSLAVALAPFLHACVRHGSSHGPCTTAAARVHVRPHLHLGLHGDLQGLCPACTQVVAKLEQTEASYQSLQAKRKVVDSDKEALVQVRGRAVRRPAAGCGMHTGAL